MNFCKRSYQPILRYLYTETIKRGGEISLHNIFVVNEIQKLLYIQAGIQCNFGENYTRNEDILKTVWP